MHRYELSQTDAIRILAGAIRNMASAPGPIFTPYNGLDLAIRNGMLCRTDAGMSHYERGFAPIASMDELLAMSNEALFQRVTGELIHV